MSRPAFVRPLSASLFLAAAVGLGLSSLGGCGREQKREVIDVNPGGQGPAAVAEDGQCGRWLDDATAMLVPGDLGRTAEADKAALLLSLYLQQKACTGVDPGPLPLDAAAEKVVAQILGEDGVATVTERRVDAGDARFFRTRRMDAAAVDAALGPGGERNMEPEAIAVALNRYVAERLFPLGSTGAPRTPGTTYDARLRGEGDWADRAWLLADLLRQARLDGVLLTPWGTGEPSEPTAWVGVLLPGEPATVALFDMRTGLPVPSPGDPDRPARLNEVRTDAAARTAMTAFYESAELPVPDEAALENLTPQLIGEPGWWRLASGLVSLPPVGNATGGPAASGRVPRTFDPLHDRTIEKGLVNRVAAAGFEENALTVWPVPAERGAEAAAAFPETLAAPLRIGVKPPGGVTITEEGQFVDRNGEPIDDVAGSAIETGTSDKLWTARHAQLAGGRDGAREAAGILEEVLSPEQTGSLFSPRPLPPVTEAEIRGELASAQRNAAAMGEGRDVGGSVSRDARTENAILRAAAANGLAPWPPGTPLPEAFQAVQAAAIPEAALFFAEVQAERGRPDAAARLLNDLLNGPPNVRKATAASLLAKIIADDDDPATAARLARQFVGGPDGPRLKAWIARWTAPPPSDASPSAQENAADADAAESDDPESDAPESDAAE
ncbi:hypothetical protein [Alienimonas chondri]|uniref:Uncharacterized protein n=1 Tax=Alienimonas chondri TaxID=2681879 RepID=A0ABX1VG38_9PLAN|nr:hypothetical protein [Alienimonas chondri]NNJ26719.1 hypothetical protein [Alienimonas chondri]